jgi:hypothetical protein
MQQGKTRVQTRASGPGPLRHNRDYLLLVGGQVVSTPGWQFSLIAFPLLALFLTSSPAQVGLIGSVQRLPYLLLSLASIPVAYAPGI